MYNKNSLVSFIFTWKKQMKKCVSTNPMFPYTRLVEHASVELLGQWCSGRSNATPRWDAVSSGRCGESC